MADLITAEEAAQRLGVKRATLYTYVSRGVLSRHRHGAESRFARDEVDALARARRHPGAPADLLGMRSVRSAVSEVREGELFLRGVPLADLADEPFEEVRDLVLGPGPVDRVEVPDHVVGLPLARRLPALALAAGAARLPLDAATARSAGAGLLAVVPVVFGGGPGPLAGSLFRALAGRSGHPTEVATLDTALVSLVDHGLAASVVAARVTASARASAYDCLAAGYAALSGRLHGGIGPAALASLRGDTTDTTVATEGSHAGLGHWRHPYGDPRADAILARLALVDGSAEVLARLDERADRLGRRPNVDGALAALVLVCGLADDAGEVCFQVGRTVGMTAHVVEELDEDPLRWRARDPGPS